MLNIADILINQKYLDDLWKGDDFMAKIVTFEKPQSVNRSRWLLDNIGRTSVALETPFDDIVDIIAYSDAPEDRKDLFKLAKDRKGLIVRNISEKRECCID